MPHKVIIASKNPVKIEACKLGFQSMFPDQVFNYEGVSVESGVSDQPLSEKETFEGAVNRTINAQNLKPEADFWVGMEGGIAQKDEKMKAFAWIVIQGKSKRGQSCTATFELPAKVVELIGQGMELGEADDLVFGKSNSKQKNGAVGLLTGNALTRATYYQQAVILALIPFKNEKLYY